MRIPWWLVIPAAALGGVAIASRRLAIVEDLDWKTVEKPGRLIDVDSYRVHYLDQGTGTPLVLVHGFGGHTYSYREIIALMSSRYRCIAVDLKGFGYSERRADAGLSHTDQVAMLASLLDRLGVDDAVFVGHSMGGAVVQRFAASFPHRVSALVLAAAVTGDERVGRSVAHIAPWLMPALPLLAGAAARGLLSRAFSHGSGPSSTVREAYLRPVRIRGSMDGLVAMINDGAGRDTPIDRSRITMPVLLLYGADDRVVPVSARRRLQEMLPQARMVIIERAGHLLLEERPEDCVAAIERCLAEGSTSALAPAGSVVSGRRV